MAVAPNADAHGCVHVWDVWNRLDHTRYRDRTPRFVAEFGWQAPPTWATLRAAISDDPLTPTSPGMAHHQKAEDGDGKLARGLAHHFATPGDFDDWLWATQLNQARAVRNGVEHFRALRGTCMGTIWWQLNDSWPVTSWALLDASGRPKPAWYALRDAYAPRLLTIQPRGAALAAVAVNDTAEPWRVDGEVRRHDARRRRPRRGRASISSSTPGRSGWWCCRRACPRRGRRQREHLLADAGGMRAWWWFVADRDVRYPPAPLEAEVERARHRAPAGQAARRRAGP